MRSDTDVKLQPRRQPGRINAKARAFDREIARLHREGYTGEAIREALADAGVQVSKSTVQREIARYVKQQLAVDSRAPTAHEPGPPPLITGERRSGKEVAESFVKGRITNPLLRPKGTP